MVGQQVTVQIKVDDRWRNVMTDEQGKFSYKFLAPMQEGDYNIEIKAELKPRPGFGGSGAEKTITIPLTVRKPKAPEVQVIRQECESENKKLVCKNNIVCSSGEDKLLTIKITNPNEEDIEYKMDASYFGGLSGEFSRTVVKVEAGKTESVSLKLFHPTGPKSVRPMVQIHVKDPVHGGGSVTKTVNYVAYSKQRPSVSFTPSTLSGYIEHEQQLKLHIQNNDPDGCDGDEFTIIPEVSDLNIEISKDGSPVQRLIVKPGRPETVNVKLIPRANAGGEYNIKLNVMRGDIESVLSQVEHVQELEVYADGRYIYYNEAGALKKLGTGAQPELIATNVLDFAVDDSYNFEPVGSVVDTISVDYETISYPGIGGEEGKLILTPYGDQWNFVALPVVPYKEMTVTDLKKECDGIIDVWRYSGSGNCGELGKTFPCTFLKDNDKIEAGVPYQIRTTKYCAIDIPGEAYSVAGKPVELLSDEGGCFAAPSKSVAYNDVRGTCPKLSRKHKLFVYNALKRDWVTATNLEPGKGYMIASYGNCQLHTCEEDDDGIDATTGGTVTIDGEHEWKDTCVSDGLKEYYCDGTDGTRAKSVVKSCPEFCREKNPYLTGTCEEDQFGVGYCKCDAMKAPETDVYYIYMTSTGSKQLVKKSQGLTTVLATDLNNPKDMDVGSDYVYWTEYEEGKVYRIRIDGGAKEVYVTGLVNPVGLNYQDGNLYVTERGLAEWEITSGSTNPGAATIVKTALEGSRALRLTGDIEVSQKVSGLIKFYAKGKVLVNGEVCGDSDQWTKCEVQANGELKIRPDTIAYLDGFEGSGIENGGFEERDGKVWKVASSKELVGKFQDPVDVYAEGRKVYVLEFGIDDGSIIEAGNGNTLITNIVAPTSIYVSGEQLYWIEGGRMKVVAKNAQTVTANLMFSLEGYKAPALTISPKTAQGVASREVLYTINIARNDNKFLEEKMTYNIQVTPPSGWLFSGDSSVTLGRVEDKNVKIRIVSDENAVKGTYPVKIRVYNDFVEAETTVYYEITEEMFSVPSLSIEPSILTTEQLTTVRYTATLTNNDAIFNPARNFVLTLEKPAGWSGSLPNTIRVEPKESKSFSIDITPVAGTTAGTYGLRLTASSSAPEIIRSVSAEDVKIADGKIYYNSDGNINVMDKDGRNERTIVHQGAGRFAVSETVEPVMYLAMDEGAGSVVRDSAGDNHGTIYGAEWVDGIKGKALKFDGKDDYVNLGSDDVLRPNGDFTFSIWFKGQEEGDHGLMSNMKYGNSVYNGISIRQADNSIHVILGNRGIVHKYFPINRDETWKHVVLVYKDGTAYVYVNGNYLGSLTGEISYLNSDFVVGRWSIDYNDYYYKGIIDEVKIYDKAFYDDKIYYLSGKEVKRINKDGSGEIEKWCDDSWAVVCSGESKIGLLTDIDVDDTWVYVTEFDEGRIYQIHKGTGEKAVLRGSLSGPNSLAVSEGNIYWAEMVPAGKHVPRGLRKPLIGAHGLTTDAYKGNYAYHYDYPTLSSWGGLVFGSIKTEQGKTYEYRGYVKYNVPECHGIFVMSCSTADKGTHCVPANSYYANTNWQYTWVPGSENGRDRYLRGESGWRETGGRVRMCDVPYGGCTLSLVYTRCGYGEVWLDDLWFGEVKEDGTLGPNLIENPGFEEIKGALENKKIEDMRGKKIHVFQPWQIPSVVAPKDSDYYGDPYKSDIRLYVPIGNIGTEEAEVRVRFVFTQGDVSLSTEESVLLKSMEYKTFIFQPEGMECTSAWKNSDCQLTLEYSDGDKIITKDISCSTGYGPGGDVNRTRNYCRISARKTVSEEWTPKFTNFVPKDIVLVGEKELYYTTESEGKGRIVYYKGGEEIVMVSNIKGIGGLDADADYLYYADDVGVKKIPRKISATSVDFSLVYSPVVEPERPSCWPVVSASQEQLQARAGDTLRYAVSVQNGNDLDCKKQKLYLSAKSELRTEIEMEGERVSELVLDGNQKKDVKLTVTSSEHTKAGVYEAKVLASSVLPEMSKYSVSNVKDVVFADGVMYVNNDNEIKKIGNVTETIVGDRAGVVGKFSVDDSYVYWIEGYGKPTLYAIYRVKKDGTGEITAVAKGLSLPTSLASADAEGKIYWVDVDGVRSIDKNNKCGDVEVCRGLQNDKLTSDSAAAVYSYGKYVFWADNEGLHQYDNETNIDNVVITEQGITDLTVVDNKIYFTKQDEIWQYQDGGPAQVIAFASANGITTDVDKIYWGSYYGIEQLNKSVVAGDVSVQYIIGPPEICGDGIDNNDPDTDVDWQDSDCCVSDGVGISHVDSDGNVVYLNNPLEICKQECGAHRGCDGLDVINQYCDTNCQPFEAFTTGDTCGNGFLNDIEECDPGLADQCAQSTERTIGFKVERRDEYGVCNCNGAIGQCEESEWEFEACLGSCAGHSPGDEFNNGYCNDDCVFVSYADPSPFDSVDVQDDQQISTGVRFSVSGSVTHPIIYVCKGDVISDSTVESCKRGNNYCTITAPLVGGSCDYRCTESNKEFTYFFVATSVVGDLVDEKRDTYVRYAQCPDYHLDKIEKLKIFFNPVRDKLIAIKNGAILQRRTMLDEDENADTINEEECICAIDNSYKTAGMDCTTELRGALNVVTDYERFVDGQLRYPTTQSYDSVLGELRSAYSELGMADNVDGKIDNVADVCTGLI
jgi:uncharacterized membrane protein